jgi:hypothetical protein
MCADSAGYVSSTCPPAPWEPFNSVQSAAIGFGRNFSPTYDQMALISYSSTASTDQPLGSAFGAGSAFETAVNAMTPGGSTNISAALDLAHQQLVGPSVDSRTARIVVLLTDGIPNLPVNTTVGQSEARARAQEIADDGIRIYVIGLGQGVDDALLQDIAAIGSGVYLNAPAAADLDAAFQTIANLAHARLAQ